MYDFNNLNNNQSSNDNDIRFSKNHERELDLIKEHLKKNDSIQEQKFKEVSKIPIYFSEINLKNMTAHKKEILWKHYIIKLPENGCCFFDFLDFTIFFLILDEEIIFEGELLKYKPGLNFNYVKRWCQLTPKYFRYFYFFQLNAREIINIDISKTNWEQNVGM